MVLDSYHPAQYGGTGRIGDWDLISSILISTPFFLAGGLNADNLEQAIHMVRPMGVDLSGGVETGGVKTKKRFCRRWLWPIGCDDIGGGLSWNRAVLENTADSLSRKR